MKRQVTTVCPKTGRTIWTYLDCGPGAAKSHHGQGPVRSMAAGAITATKVGHLQPQPGVSSRGTSKEHR